MLNVFICEDQQEQLDAICRFVRNTILIEGLEMQIAAAAKDPWEVLQKMEEYPLPGVYILDICLNSDLTGLSLAERIRERDPRGFIIFLTTYGEMSPLTFAYKTEAMDFIIKSEVENRKERIRNCLLTAYRRYHSERDELRPKFVIRTRDQVTSVEFQKIISFASAKERNKVILTGEDRYMEFRGSLKTVEQNLDDRFVRCDQSCIVNRDKIIQIDRKEKMIHLSNGMDCPVSIRMLGKLLKA